MAISNRVELVMQKRQTRAMIDADPSEVRFVRTKRTQSQVDGSWIDDPITLDPQRITWLYAYIGRRGRQNEPYNESMRAVPYEKDTILGMPDLDVERGDTFTLDGIEYRVSFVYNNREYEKTANVETVQARTE